MDPRTFNLFREKSVYNGLSDTLQPLLRRRPQARNEIVKEFVIAQVVRYMCPTKSPSSPFVGAL